MSPHIEMYILEVKHFYCSVDVNEKGVIVDAAPIARWAIGKDMETVEKWARSKGGSLFRPSVTRFNRGSGNGQANRGADETGRDDLQGWGL